VLGFAILSFLLAITNESIKSLPLNQVYHQLPVCYVK
jgi:hypothetical protein